MILKNWICAAGFTVALLSGCKNAQREVKPEAAKPAQEAAPLQPVLPAPVVIPSPALVTPSPVTSPTPVSVPSPVASPSPVIVAAAKTITQLGVRIARGGQAKDSTSSIDVTDLSNLQGEYEKSSANEIELVYLNVVPLPRAGVDRPLFFAWKQDAYNSPIVDASYQFRMVDSLNNSTKEMNRQSVNFDRERKIWSIPFSALYGGTEASVDPGWQNVLDLSLLLQDRTVLNFQIRFRARGPLVHAQLINQTHYAFSAGLGEVPKVQAHAKALRQGIEVRRDLLVNPESRRLKAWFQPQVNELEWITGISALKYFPGGNQEVPGSAVEFSKAVGKGKVQRLRYESNQGRSGEIVLDPNGGVYSLELMPNEKVTLRWIALPYGNRENCVVPADFTRTITWAIPRRERCTRGECSPREDKIISHVRTDQTSISMLQSRGAFQFSFWITDREFEGDPIHPQKGWGAYVSDPQVERIPLVGASIGNPGERVICQGVY